VALKTILAFKIEFILKAKPATSLPYRRDGANKLFQFYMAACQSKDDER
jgi:hypothetical protein